MAEYEDRSKKFLGPVEAGWIHDLVKSEIFPEADGIFSQSSILNPQQLVEESTIEFLTELRRYFSEFTKSFNFHSEQGEKFSEIKLYGIAQSISDFMLYRNQIKLMISNTSHGLIQVTFAEHVRSSVSINGSVQSKDQAKLSGGFLQAQELVAELGPFREVIWTFQGEKVDPEKVAKYYFIEFVKATRNASKKPASNQALLDEIRNLLEKRGLQL